MVLRAVEEHRVAVLVGALLEVLPPPVELGVERDRNQPSERAPHAAGLGYEHRPAGLEVRVQTRRLGDPVDTVDVFGEHRLARVRSHPGVHRLGERPRGLTIRVPEAFFLIEEPALQEEGPVHLRGGRDLVAGGGVVLMQVHETLENLEVALRRRARVVGADLEHGSSVPLQTGICHLTG